MKEKQLEMALKDIWPQLPQGFAERSERQLARLTAQKEERHMKKTGILILAAALAIAFTTALAAGIISANTRRGLEENLNVDEDTKQLFEGTALFDEPNLSVSDNGVTVTLEECVVDSYAAYVAFRVQGYTPSDTSLQPDFDVVQYDFGVTGHSGSSAFNNWSRNEGGAYRENYYDENGELLYIIQLVSLDETLLGKTARVEFRDLGVIRRKADVTVEVNGTWTFEWKLKGTEECAEKQLNAPIGDSAATLTHVLITPVHIEVSYEAPELRFDEDGFALSPTEFCGFTLDDGSTYRFAYDSGFFGYTTEGGVEFTQKNALTKVIRPESVTEIIFFITESGEYVNVSVQ